MARSVKKVLLLGAVGAAGLWLLLRGKPSAAAKPPDLALDLSDHIYLDAPNDWLYDDATVRNTGLLPATFRVWMRYRVFTQEGVLAQDNLASVDPSEQQFATLNPGESKTLKLSRHVSTARDTFGPRADVQVSTTIDLTDPQAHTGFATGSIVHLTFVGAAAKTRHYRGW